MAITQVISNFPPAPNSSTDTPQEFNTKADAFVNHQSGIYTPEVNTWATEANVLADEINATVATLPDGVIDDATPSGINTYSSNKITALIDAVPFTEINDAVSSLTEAYSSQKIEDLSTTNVKIAGSSMTGTLNTPEVNIGGNIVDPINYGIESGSNANGYYTKFPDGTMICTSPELPVEATSEAVGDIFRSPNTTSWTYPETFISIPATSVSNSVNTSWMVVTYGLNSCTFRGFNATSSATARDAVLMAVGRWK